MKKQLLFIVFSTLSLVVNASVKIGGIYYDLNSSTQTAEVAYSIYSGDVVIPSSVNYDGIDYAVTGIASNAFINSPQLTSLTIPKSVTTINYKRDFFRNSERLASIVVEEGNPNYDSRENCNALIETASNKLLHGAINAFIPNSVSTIGVGAFSCCAGLTHLIIPNSVTSIEDGAFSECHELTSVYIGTGLENIGNFIFSDCENLKTIEINSNALVSKDYNNVGPNAGGFGSRVEEIILGDNVTSIGNYAFQGCAMTSVRMSDNLKRIGDHAFEQCPYLTSIEFSNNLEYIGQWAFSGCIWLPSVTIPESVTCIKSVAFSLCNSLTKVVINSNEVVAREHEQYYTLMSCFGSQVKEFVLGEDVKKIAYQAFARINKLTTVIIPGNVTCVDDSAFYQCTGLKDVYYYAEQVPETCKDVFVESNYKSATLHVPANAVEAYRRAEQWKDFGNIVALNGDDPKPTGVESVSNNGKTAERYYTIDGKQIPAPRRGLNMIKMSDGTTRKVVLK